jgi:uncharacterized repeat protein (TIGR01451 family)
VRVGATIFYVITVRNAGPATATGVVVEDTLPSGVSVIRTNPACGGSGSRRSCPLGTIAAGQTRTVQIDVIANTTGSKTNTAFALGAEVDPNMGNNTASVTTSVNPLKTSEEGAAEPLSFENELRLARPPEGATGTVVVNGSALLQVRSGPPARHRVGASSGTNRFEAALDAGVDCVGSWRFDFRPDGKIVSGSLRVESGEVLSLSPDAVVFSVRGGAAPIRFTVELP